MRIFLTVIVFSLFSSIGFSQVNDNVLVEKVKVELIDDFLENFYSSPEESVLKLFKDTSEFERVFEQVQEVGSQLNDVNERFGEYYGYELILEKSIGENLRLYSYLMKYEVEPVRFTFVVYKPNDKYLLHSFDFDNNIIDELKEASKALLLYQEHNSDSIQ